MSQTTPAKLERRARALLRAYPAEYRRDRAEEIIDTLLEATPAGLAYPSARDSWALIAGGLHARAARNRSQGTAASLRLALLLGAAVFLSLSINFLVAMPLAGPGQAARPWLIAVACVLSTAAGLAPWLWSRAVTVALVIPSGALFAILVLGAAPGDSLTRSDMISQYDSDILLRGPGLSAAGSLVIVLPLAASLAIALAVMRLLFRRTAPASRPLP